MQVLGASHWSLKLVSLETKCNQCSYAGKGLNQRPGPHTPEKARAHVYWQIVYSPKKCNGGSPQLFANVDWTLQITSASKHAWKSQNMSFQYFPNKTFCGFLFSPPRCFHFQKNFFFYKGLNSPETTCFFCCYPIQPLDCKNPLSSHLGSSVWRRLKFRSALAFARDQNRSSRPLFCHQLVLKACVQNVDGPDFQLACSRELHPAMPAQHLVHMWSYCTCYLNASVHGTETSDTLRGLYGLGFAFAATLVPM